MDGVAAPDLRVPLPLATGDHIGSCEDEAGIAHEMQSTYGREPFPEPASV
ncbi:hypothetical protein [Methylobacterium fujisawaense]